MSSEPNSQRRVLGLAGSLRRGSYNRRLLDAAVELAPPALSLSPYDDAVALPLFDEDLEGPHGGPEAVQRLRRAVAAADALLIATPEYNQSLPGVLKNMLDWLSRPAPDEVLEGKPVSIIGASTGPWGTRLAQSSLRQVLHATGAHVLPGPALYLREAARMFDPAGHLVDEAARKKLRAVLESLAGWLRIR
jgi:chromate reductase, NAD(P)H dehydrogenase (quinone)